MHPGEKKKAETLSSGPWYLLCSASALKLVALFWPPAEEVGEFIWGSGYKHRAKQFSGGLSSVFGHLIFNIEMLFHWTPG